MSNSNISILNDREAAVLITLIEGYIQHNSPVSSTFLSNNYNLNVSSATIRNVMSTLEDKGYLTHLHTSGGRLPTDLGYRFYVDSIKSLNNPKNLISKDLQTELLTISNNVDELLNATVLMLSKVSNMFGVVTISGYQDSILTDIELVPIQGGRAMLVLALDTGVVKSIVLNLDIKLDIKLINKTTQILKDRLVALTLKEIQNSIISRLNDVEIYSHELVQILINDRSNYFTIDSNKSIYTSSTEVLLEQPEFNSIASFKKILPALEKNFLNKHFRTNFTLGSEPTLIGRENGDSRLNECAIMTTYFESGTISGKIGVVGPKRIPYHSLQSILEQFTEIVESAI
jgi:heat-inducible transcriptional repressor